MASMKTVTYGGRNVLVKDNYVAKWSVWYNNNIDGSCTGCVKGTVDGGVENGQGRHGANVLDNCVGFANGAFNETFYENKKAQGINLPRKQYFKLQSHAYQFPDVAKNRRNHAAFSTNVDGKPLIDWGKTDSDWNNFKSSFILPPTAYPPLGGLIIWGGTGCNHVAYIQEVKDANTITILHTYWGTSSSYLTSDGNGYTVNQKTITRDGGGYKGRWHYGGSSGKSGAKCLGFIANPAVYIPIEKDPTGASTTKPTVVPPVNPVDPPTKPVEPPSPPDEPLTPPATAPSISVVKQLSPVSLSISGKKVSLSPYIIYTNIYYKWHYGDSAPSTLEYASISSNDGVKQVRGDSFEVTIDKPRSATFISVFPVNYTNTDPYPSEYGNGAMMVPLQKSYPRVTISDGGEKRSAIPYVYTNKHWVQAIPTIRQNSKWQQLYNTGKEEVK